MPAITSPLNKALVLRGVTAATLPSLRGDVIFESEIPFRLKSLASAPGVLTQQVIKEHGRGLLTFAYRIALTETDYDAELKFTTAFSLSGLAVHFADFRVDRSGTTHPNYFDFSPVEGYGFKFSYGISAGSASRFFFIATNAKEFRESRGKVSLITGQRSITLEVASPLSVAPARWTAVKSDALVITEEDQAISLPDGSELSQANVEPSS